MGRYRLLVIKDTGQSSKGDCNKRAEFESKIRNGKYLKTSHLLKGWRNKSGNLWNINTLVEIYDYILGITSENRLITKVIFKLDSGGSTTQLETMPADAYNREVKNSDEKKTTETTKGWGDVK
jgi:prophage tail gpP-like protein